MTEMKIVGPEARGAEARAAMRRFRTEIDYALGLIPGTPERTKHTDLDVISATTALAEIMAMVRAMGRAIDEAFPEGHPQRAYVAQRFGGDLRWAEHYHEVAR